MGPCVKQSTKEQRAVKDCDGKYTSLLTRDVVNEMLMLVVILLMFVCLLLLLVSCVSVLCIYCAGM